MRNYSEEIAAEIDKEVNRIISEQYQRTEQILNEHMDSLELVANALLEREKLEGEEFKTLIETGSLPPLDSEETPAAAQEQPAEETAAQEPVQAPVEAQENAAQPPVETLEESDAQADQINEPADE